MLSRDNLFKLIREKEVFRDAGTQFVVVDENLNIVYYNDSPVTEAKQISPGDLLKCQNALHSKGCGCHANCSKCALRNMVSKSLETETKMNADVKLLLDKNNQFDFKAISTPIFDEGKKYAIVLLIDLTTDNRELMMERIFFHDVINLAGAMNTLVDCVENSNREEMMAVIKDVSSQLMEELTSQKNLIYAQKGILETHNSILIAKETLQKIHEELSKVAMNRFSVNLIVDTQLSDEQIEEDPVLLHRVLLNMIKNACEASRPGEYVIIGGYSTDDRVVFSVHHNGVIPDDIKSHKFINGNSSKGAGRGLGTYSIKLLGENYLNGKVWFTSGNFVILCDF